MKAFLSLLVAALVAIPAAAQPAPIECPLPPYQLPLQAPERSFIDEAGDIVISGVDEPLVLPDGHKATETVWSDDGEVLLIASGAPGFETFVWAYQNGELIPMLGGETLFSLRTEEFRDAVQIFNPAFIPDTHAVLFNTQILTDADGIYFEIPSDLYFLEVDSHTFTKLLPYGEAGNFSIAPDGSGLVMADFDHLWWTDIDGSSPRTITETSVALGLGEEVMYPPVVWDTSGENIAFRTLLFPTYDPNNGGMSAPFEVKQFTLGEPGEEITSETLLTGPTQFFWGVKLSPDGYRIAQWKWQDNTQPTAFDVTISSPDSEPLVLATVDVPGGGITPFVQWDDETHVTYGFSDANNGNTVTSWRADLCGEITPLDPYVMDVPSQQ